MGFSSICIIAGNNRTSCTGRLIFSFSFSWLILAVLLSQLLVVSPLMVHASETIPSDDKEITNFRIKIRRLQQGIMRHEDQVNETENKEQNILSELEILDKKIVFQQDKLRELETKMQKQQSLIDKEENALHKIRGEKTIVEDHLKKRIAAYYTMGDIGLLNVTFSTQTLPELLTFHDAFDTLIRYDQDVIKVYRETIKEIERAKSALGLEKALLQEFITQTTAEKNLLEKAKDEKHILLTQVRTQTKLHKQAIEEMNQASEDLSQSITTIKSKHQIVEQTFLANKGNLPPPIDGVLITLFQQEKVNKLGVSRKVQGIELQAPDGKNIIAVAEGEVIFAGYLRGYGNTVIIHHGFQYYTVTSRIEKISVTKGQKIKKEETIGIMGDTATLFDEGLYFEIRQGRQSLDPIIWLNPNRLATVHEQSTARPDRSGYAQ